jgi:hypothetical protein
VFGLALLSGVREITKTKRRISVVDIEKRRRRNSPSTETAVLVMQLERGGVSYRHRDRPNIS